MSRLKTEAGCLLPLNLVDHVHPFLTTSSTFIPVCSRLTGCYSPHKTYIIYLSSIKTGGGGGVSPAQMQLSMMQREYLTTKCAMK